MFGLGRKATAPRIARVPSGVRVYAIGDVHGRLDLLTDVLRRIEADSAARAPAAVHVVMLGDLIDRGPHSAQIIDLFLAGPPAFARFHFVMGNHEEMLLRQIDAPDVEGMARFLHFGGRATFASYGVPDDRLDPTSIAAIDVLTAAIPDPHRAFMATMADQIAFGDYLFVHAGIRPGLPIAEQSPRDLRWIRDHFLDSDADHGPVVVHGHTIAAAPELRHNRIGIDTGAYRSGRLTALGLDDAERWFVATPG